MSGDELKDGGGASVVICNDYHEILKQKTGLSEGTSCVTVMRSSSPRGEGTVRRSSPRPIDTTLPAVTPTRIVDPTGVGDAFRGGLMKGWRSVSAVRWATGSAASPRPALEHLGGQSHAYSLQEFSERYCQHFPALALIAG